MRQLLLIIISSFVVSSCGGLAPITPYKIKNSDKFIKEAKSEIGRSLIDEDSAKYRDLEIFQNEKGTVYLCGYFNSKNRMGGYTGYSKFIYSHEDGFCYMGIDFKPKPLYCSFTLPLDGCP